MEETAQEKQPQDPQEQPILEQLREYVETRIKLGKYKAIEKSTSVISGIITDMMILISLVLTFMFASFTLALFLGKVLHCYWGGFGIVALLYLIAAIVIIMNKAKFRKPIINKLISKILSDN